MSGHWEIVQDPFTSEPRLVGIKCNGELAFIAVQGEDEEEKRVNDRVRSVVTACNNFEEIYEALKIAVTMFPGDPYPDERKVLENITALLARIEGGE